MRRYVWVAVVVVALVLVGIVGVRLAHARKGSGAPQYALAAAAYGNLFVNVTGNGTVQAATALNVQASQSGTITSVPVQVGQHVAKAQVLATVNDSGSLQTQLLSAKAQLASDEASLNALVSPTPPTAAQIAAQKEKVLADQQRVASDQQEIQGLNVQAPFNGDISEMDVSPGQSVGQGTTLFQIVNPQDATVVANFPSINLQNAFVGEGAQVTVPGIGTIGATVASIGVVSSGQGRGGALYPITLNLQSPPGSLRSGMSATVSIPNDYTYAQGTISFGQTEDVTAQASGTVQSVSAVVGSVVTQGTTIVTLSAPSLATQLASDESVLSSDQNTLSQLENPTPPAADQVASLKARIAVDQQNVANAEQSLSQLNVTSPIAGIVTAVNAQVGASTSSGGSSTSGTTGLFSVEDPNSLQVLVPIDELSIAQLSVGQRAIVTANALPGQTFFGTVSEISPSGTNSQGVATFNVMISVPHPGKLLAGMSANVSILVAHATHALLVPVEAVNGFGSQGAVLVHTAKGNVPTRVTVGLSNDVSAQILSGLKPGEEVVTAQVTSTSTTQSGGFGFGGGAGRRLSGNGGGGNFRGNGGGGGGGGGQGGN